MDIKNFFTPAGRGQQFPLSKRRSGQLETQGQSFIV
jgi:hypothetical protein